MATDYSQFGQKAADEHAQRRAEAERSAETEEQNDSDTESSPRPKKKNKREEPRNEIHAKIIEARKRADELAPEFKNAGKDSKKGEKNKGGLKRFTKTRSWEAVKKEQTLVQKIKEKDGAKFVWYATTPLSALAYLGYQVTVRPAVAVAKETPSVLDGALKRIADWGEKLVNTKLPGVGMVSKAVGFIEKKAGLDKTLAEVLRKEKEDRKKLVEKLLKQEADESKKYKKKKKDSKDKREKEQQRRRRWREQFGDEAALLLVAEARDMEGDIEKASGSEDQKEAA